MELLMMPLIRVLHGDGGELNPRKRSRRQGAIASSSSSETPRSLSAGSTRNSPPYASSIGGANRLPSGGGRHPAAAVPAHPRRRQERCRARPLSRWA
jgi:hypothetical protein